MAAGLLLLKWTSNHPIVELKREKMEFVYRGTFFQSSHSGIETVASPAHFSRLVSSNHPIVELKRENDEIYKYHYLLPIIP